MSISGIEISKIMNMAANSSFVIQSNQKNSQLGQSSLNNIPNPLPNAFGGMTGKETVFDILQNQQQTQAQGNILDLLA